MKTESSLRAFNYLGICETGGICKGEWSSVQQKRLIESLIWTFVIWLLITHTSVVFSLHSEPFVKHGARYLIPGGLPED